MLWDDLQGFAPHTKATWETLGNSPARAVLDSVPNWLFGKPVDPGAPGWANFLDEIPVPHRGDGLSNREIMLRYILTRAIVDQGADIEGVHQWHDDTLSRSRAIGIDVLTDLTTTIQRYKEVVDIADEVCREVFADRAEAWAADSPGKSPKQYSVFTINGIRTKGTAHWFVSTRVLPVILLGQLHPDGLAGLVFDRCSSETPKQMAQRVRNGVEETGSDGQTMVDDRYGLDYVIGDKACDLFAKWVVGSFHVHDGIPNCPWQPIDCPIPMDQRIGILMIRCGFMEEFFGVAREMSIASHGWEPKGAAGMQGTRPSKTDPRLPLGLWHLWVMNFRRQGVVRVPPALSWARSAAKKFGLSPKRIGPQELVTLLCHAYNEKYSPVPLLSPVDVDDFFMAVGGSPCSDADPDCPSCALKTACMANNAPGFDRLKDYST